MRLNECARQSNTISLDYLVSFCDLDTRDPNALTVLRSFGPRLTKFIRANGEIVSNDEARNHTASVVSVATQEQLIALLKVLERRPDCEIVCGAIVETANRWRMRRLKNDDPKTGDKATLEDVPRHVFPLDVDSVATPVGLDPHDLKSRRNRRSLCIAEGVRRGRLRRCGHERLPAQARPAISVLVSVRPGADLRRAETVDATREGADRPRATARGGRGLHGRPGLRKPRRRPIARRAASRARRRRVCVGAEHGGTAGGGIFPAQPRPSLF